MYPNVPLTTAWSGVHRPRSSAATVPGLVMTVAGFWNLVTAQSTRSATIAEPDQSDVSEERSQQVTAYRSSELRLPAQGLAGPHLRARGSAVG